MMRVRFRGEAQEASLATFNFDLDLINVPGTIMIPTRAVNKVVSADSICLLGFTWREVSSPRKGPCGRV